MTTESMPPPDVGIIGAGITGLTAAFHLARAGFAVTVYEASDRAGGVICSHREGDWLAEGGPNTILQTAPAIGDLLDRLGLASRRCDSDPAAGARYVVRGGQPVDLPTSAWHFFRSSLFSGRAKLRLLGEPFIARGSGNESVADFVRRRLGQEFLDYAIDPLVTGIYAGDPAALSIRHAFPRIHALEATYGSLIRGQIFGARARRKRGDVSKANAKKFSFDDGLQVLPDTLRDHLGSAVRLRTRVLAIQRAAPGWELSLDQAGTTASQRHRAVLFCGTALSLARLKIQVPAAPDLSSLAKVHYPPVTSVVLGFRRADVRHPCQGFGMLIPHREGFGILGTIFSSSLFPRRAPDGHLTLTIYVGGVRNPEAAQLAEDPLVDLVRRDLGRLLGVEGAPVFRRITRWPHAIPQYNLGYEVPLQVLADLEHAAPGFFVTGHFRDGVALSDSLLNGGRVAERIGEYLRGGVAAAAAPAGLPTPSPLPKPS